MQIDIQSKVYDTLLAGLVLLSFTAQAAKPQNTPVSTVQGVLQGAPVQASAASDFVDSIGVSTHFDVPQYADNIVQLTQLLLASGIRHIRDGPIPNALKTLSVYGVTQTLVIDPPHGLVPNSTYWSAAPPERTTTISNFIKSMPANSVEALEMPNELDVYFYMYKWHPTDANTLSSDSSSANYYGKYGDAVTRDSWAALKSDRALAGVKVIGPTIGIQVPSPYADGSLANYVDYGGFHTYPGRANTWTYPQPYGTIPRYYWNSFEPSVNVGQDNDGGNPLLFSWYAGAFSDGINPKQMISTETGYNTGTQYRGSISLTAQAKYIPRLFAEYYRNNIARTFLYELFDERMDPTDSGANCGLIMNDFTPKPAYTALQSLITLLQDSGSSFTPSRLAYSLQAQPNGDYNRTDYIHDLLLQKSGGDYYLLIWHEISNSSDTDTSGNLLPGMMRDISPPALTTTINLPTSISSATQYAYDENWTLQPHPVSILKNSITISASDTVSVIQLSK